MARRSFRYVLRWNDDGRHTRRIYTARMRPTHRATAPRTVRPGFSIVEVIVAMMIVSIGLLGIAGASTLALRTTLDAARRRDGAERAQARLALLAAGGCARATSGRATDSTRRIAEQWTVRVSNNFQQVTDSVTWVGASGNASFALTSALPC